MPIEPSRIACVSVASARGGCLLLFGAVAVLLAVPAPAAALSSGLQTRRERLLAMTPEQKGRLYHNQERLAALPPAEQQKLRTLADALEADPQADHLRQVLVRYHDWLKKLSPGQRAELLELPAEQRVAKIKELRAEQTRKIQQESAAGEPLSAADFHQITRWLEDYAWKHRDVLLQDAPPEVRRHFEQLNGDNKRHRAALWLLTQRWRLGRTSNLPGFSEADIGALADKLSPEARERLKSTTGLTAQRQLVQRWAQGAVRHRLETLGLSRPLSPLAQHELEHFFEHDLTAEQREHLLALPPEKMQNELRRMYFLQPTHVAGVPTLVGETDSTKPAHSLKHPKQGKDKGNHRDKSQRTLDGKPEAPADGGKSGSPEEKKAAEK